MLEVEVAAKETEVAFLRPLTHPEAMVGRTEWYCGCVVPLTPGLVRECRGTLLLTRGRGEYIDTPVCSRGNGVPECSDTSIARRRIPKSRQIRGREGCKDASLVRRNKVPECSDTPMARGRNSKGTSSSGTN